MNEEKQIEEMARAMCSFSASVICRECSDSCYFKDYAKKLVEKGYRKASEVALEVIGEIEKIIDKHYNKHIFGDNDLDDLEHDAIINFSDDVTNDIDDLKEKYTEGENDNA